ncbi:MAG: hemerythrin domain-containing protein, partial [Thiobacillaceae bacterium]|nr:hemerythrin domain-containing protein [Thiobacillaceae bacterium]
QINHLLAEMRSALERADGAAYLGQSETLLMLMRQHNMKEENILYPMADQALADESGTLVARMEPIQA